MSRFIDRIIRSAKLDVHLYEEVETDTGAMGQAIGIKELAILACEKLNGTPFDPIMMAMTHFNAVHNSGHIIRLMISGTEFEKTRECYATRCLGYGQVTNGDFALIDDIPKWIASVKETAINLTKTIEILRQWKASPSEAQHFAIWLNKH